jgi:lipopolysaccharide/colanic/teichoic acid biosynthesis glycosyltransferase
VRARLIGKRALDVVGAAVGLALASPALAFAMAMIRVVDGAPVFFCQPRLGRQRRPFQIVKLRTMAAGRVTRLGAVLRELGVDELPQLLNVLRGDMALVGPRPLTGADVARLGWHGERFAARWAVRPGLTGLAQIGQARRCNARATWLLDRDYVQRCGVALDLRILAVSSLVPLLGKRRIRRALRPLGRRVA